MGPRQLITERNIQEGSAQTVHFGSADSSSSCRIRLFERLSGVFRKTFLPNHYPESVRSEFFEYQVYDSLQALCSTLRSILTTQALLRGIGVGDSTASPMAAACAWIARDGFGIIGSLGFAFLFSDDFEVNVQGWRLWADTLCNIGLLANMLVSVWPQYFLLLTAISALSGAVLNITAGAAKARISAHLAREGYLADVCAKEGTQETAVNLIGMLLGMVVASVLGDFNSTDNYRVAMHSGSETSNENINASDGDGEWSASSFIRTAGNTVAHLLNTIAAWLGQEDVFSDDQVSSHYGDGTRASGEDGSSQAYAWVLFLFLTAVHQWLNYRLVKCLVFDSLNPQRAFLIMARYATKN
jgi:hypothetical protein